MGFLIDAQGQSAMQQWHPGQEPSDCRRLVSQPHVPHERCTAKHERPASTRAHVSSSNSSCPHLAVFCTYVCIHACEIASDLSSSDNSNTLPSTPHSNSATTQTVERVASA
eukprot:2084085-Amphidinium_carterae.1